MNYDRYKQTNFKSKYNFGFKEKLIAINVIIFLITLILPNILCYFGCYSILDSNFNPIQLITHQYLHGGFIHLFFNMLGIYFLWDILKTYMSDMRILIFYTICGIVSSLGHDLVYNLLLGHESHGISIGASGAIYGLFAANYIYNKSAKILLFFIIPVKMSILFPILMIYELGSGLFVSDGVGHLSHFFGGLCGLILIKLLK